MIDQNEYIIIPAEVFEQANKTLAKKLGLDKPRKSVDGTEVIMHIKSYDRLFGGSIYETNVQSYPIYDRYSEELKELLNSSIWTRE